VSDQWLAAAEKHLQTAISFFGAGKSIATIRTREVQDYVRWLATDVPPGEWGGLARFACSKVSPLARLDGRRSRVVSQSLPARMSRLRLDSESRRPDCVRDRSVGSCGRAVFPFMGRVSRLL